MTNYEEKGDAISRNELKVLAYKQFVSNSNNAPTSMILGVSLYKTFEQLIDSIPAVDNIKQEETPRLVTKRLHGEWLSIKYPISGDIHIICSHCKEDFICKSTLEEWRKEHLFCHRCGADMQKGDAE